jgi:hypothetical protein
MPLNVQFCWSVHFDWFRPAQGSAVPVQAPHVHPSAVHALWVVEEEQLEGVPLHEAQPDAGQPLLPPLLLPASRCPCVAPDELEASGPEPPPPPSPVVPAPSLPPSSEAGPPKPGSDALDEHPAERPMASSAPMIQG